jgi:hypothetical protein
VLAETNDVVDISAHDVQFDPGRDLWFCDIAVDPGNSERSYFPFVRLALARYQPHSLTGVHLSRVALADFMQLTPDRSVSVTALSPSLRQVTLSGRAYSATAHRPSPGRVRVTVERLRAGVTDPNLKWTTVAQRQYNAVYNLNPVVITDENLVQWSGPVSLPPGNPGPLRLVIEEIELHREGFEYDAANPFLQGASERVVFTNTIEL